MSVIYEPRGRAREYAPLAVNLYRGCSHGCVYCYVPYILHCDRQAFHEIQEQRDDILVKLEADAQKYEGDDREILLCFTCDPYQHIEEKLMITRRAIEILIHHNLRFTILTKGGSRAKRDFDLFESYPKASLGTTLLFVNDADREDWEPYAASVSDRMNTIIEAHERGIRTWVSIEPVIYPEQALAVIDILSEYVDFWRIGKLNHHPHALKINWREFRDRVIQYFKSHNMTNYYIKRDLREA